MKVEHLLDLNILNIDEKEAGEVIPKDIDVVNIVNPSDTKVKGFFYRPLKIRYFMETPKDKESYLSSIKRNRRKRMLRAFRDCEDQGIVIDAEDPLTKESFNEWFKLYEKNLTSKEKGIVHLKKDWYEERRKVAVGLFAKQDGKIIGGLMLKKVPAKKSLTIAYSAVKKEFTKYSVNEYLNFEAIMLASKLGFEYVNRGKDTNMYGHHLSPGLFLFKKTFGFKIKALKKFGSVLTKIVNYDKFEDKIFFFSYGEKGMVGNLILKKEGDSSEFEADFLEKLNVFLLKDGELVEKSS